MPHISYRFRCYIVLGIPCSSEDIIVSTHMTCAPIAREYTLSKLEKYLIELLLGDKFKKVFIIFACTIVLASNSTKEGNHDRYEVVMDCNVNVERNWGKFVLQYLKHGMQDYKKRSGTYMRGCLLFLQVE